MQRPDAELEKELNSIGIATDSPVSMYAEKGIRLGVAVDIDVPKAVDVSAPDFNVVVKNRRGVITTLSDFVVTEYEDRKTLSFLAHQSCPSMLPTSAPCATSFIDLCWHAGNEAIDPDIIPEVSTKKRDGISTADLGWYLPSRFVDSLIDALGKANETILSGLLEDAMIYGPYVKDDDNA